VQASLRHSKSFYRRSFLRAFPQSARTSIKSCRDTLQMVLASASTRPGGLPRGLQIATGLLHEHRSRTVAPMGKLGDVSYGEVCHCGRSLRPVAYYADYPPFGREGSKSERGTYTGWFEVHLEKGSFWCPDDIKHTSCTITSRISLQPIIVHEYCYDVYIIISLSPPQSLEHSFFFSDRPR
jgi:hypothetical protein